MSEPRGTEAGKRKPADDDVVFGRQKKAQKNDVVGSGKSGGAAATEEEVEEFFTILRRIHVAIGHFKKAGAGDDGRKLTEEGSNLRAMLERETFSCEEADGVEDGDDARRKEGMEEKLRLDLNAEPGRDSDPV